MATLAQAECTCYPEKCRSVQARQNTEKTLRDNPDVLYADYIQLNGKRIKNNLIFRTTTINAWKLPSDAALARRPSSPRHLSPTPEPYRPIHPYMPRHRDLL
ncbi:hypothetical protein G5714_004146 [Onychostoma macrolepis]|uniref:Uncharacterized protein n=1 Tax=Onychostoma macrolepis TaxID=369639 RepID=A0A7J6DBG3_9TELE|nr:hypothetical protein G5714_004146 [Onychostoma macrolepis]